MRNLILIASLLGASSAAAHADDDKCSVEPTLVSYDKPRKLPKKADTRCDRQDGKCKRIDLQGYLYVPPASAGKGPYPVIVYNHGSGQEVKEYCQFGSYFAELGYVVFMPQRRGHGVSTGVYYADDCAGKDDAGACKMEHLRTQVDDIAKAIKFVKKRSDVDPDKVAIAGHSYGGIVSMLANQKELGQKAVINFAGGSQSWEGNDAAAAALLDAARRAVAPVYYFAPLNDASIEPTILLAKAAGQSCRQFQSALFEAVDTDGDDRITKKDYDSTRDSEGNHARDRAHGRSTKMLKRWGPSVDEFMRRYFKKPATFDELCQGTSLIPSSRGD